MKSRANPALAHLYWIGLTGLSALFMQQGFPPHKLGLFMLVSLVPLFIALDSAPSLKAALVRGWVFGFFTNLLNCTWVVHAVREFGQFSWGTGVGSLLVLSLFDQAAWAFVGACRYLLHKRFGVRPLLWTPLAFMVLDAMWPKYFPTTFGNTLYTVSWLSQAADLVGVWGLTGLLVAVSEWIAALVGRFLGSNAWSSKELRRHGFVVISLFLAMSIYGTIRLKQMRQLMAGAVSHVRVALVQPNRNAIEEVRDAKDPKCKLAKRHELLEHILGLTSRALENHPDLVVWPETAFPTTYHNSFNSREAESVVAKLDGFLERHKPSLMFGSRDTTNDGRWYNSMHFIDYGSTGHKQIEIYRKSLLLLFAEKVPFSGILNSYDDLLWKHGASFFASGPGPLVWQTSKTRFGPMICVEGLYPSYVRSIVNRGAEILVNVTNDSWFGKTAEPDLHFYLTNFRAIETRRPLVRAATSGYSALVDIDGSVQTKSNLFEEQVLFVEAPVYPSIRSLYLMYGPYLLALCALYAFVRLIAGWLYWRRSESCHHEVAL